MQRAGIVSVKLLAFASYHKPAKIALRERSGFVQSSEGEPSDLAATN